MEVDLGTLAEGKTFSHSVVFKGDDYLFPKEVPIDKTDLELLKKWKLNKAFLLKEELSFDDEHNRLYEIYLREKKHYDKVVDIFLKPLRQFYEDVRARGVGSFDFFEKSAVDVVDSLMLHPQSFLLHTMLSLARSRDQYTFTKAAFFTSLLALQLGRTIKLPRSKLLVLFECALIADLGILKVPLKIMLKDESEINDNEARFIRSHPLMSSKIVLQSMKLSKMHALIVLLHHENIDGTGFPKGLKGDQIPLYSKIIHLCQEFVGLYFGRGQRGVSPRLDYPELMNKLKGQASTTFDQTLFNCLLHGLSGYGVGSLVELSNGMVGVVLFSSKELRKPFVKLVFSDDNKLLRKGNVINLVNNTIHVKNVLYDERMLKKALDVL